MEVNRGTNNAHFYLTSGTNNAHSKLKWPKTHNRQTLGTNIVFSPKIYIISYTL